MNTLQKIIKKATAADGELLPVIERIMREDIFHGPLDWQTADELSNAAREAVKIYEADRDFHDADTRYRKARWARILAEPDLTEAPEDESLRRALSAAFSNEEAALTDLQSFSVCSG